MFEAWEVWQTFQHSNWPLITLLFFANKTPWPTQTFDAVALTHSYLDNYHQNCNVQFKASTATNCANTFFESDLTDRS